MGVEFFPFQLDIIGVEAEISESDDELAEAYTEVD
jgi:hypothetical protein